VANRLDILCVISLTMQITTTVKMTMKS